MKKLFVFITFALAIVVSSCSKFDDSEIWKKLNDHETRITAVEELCKQLNTNIDALKTIVDALEKNDYITNVSPVNKDGEVIGYTIAFAYSGTITIYNGADGENGKNGYTPVIGVAKDSDEIYYWTLDNEWLLDDAGNKIKAVGEDGEDGKDGTEGKDGINSITPQLKIENDYWYISYDNGSTWSQLGKATGEDGKDGKDGDLFFQDVDTSNDDYVVFTLTDGSLIQLPTWYAFEQLRTLCNEMNTNISSLQFLLTAIENRDYVTSCMPYMENGIQLGFTISFAKGNPIIVYHGKDGADGKDGYTPSVGVKQEPDGIYYWTLDGEWLLDANGNKVKAVGSDGKDGGNGQDGTDGQNGKDGFTPQLRIENDYWNVSYDNGETWAQLGKATGKDGADGDSFFSSVTQDDKYVYFILADGTTITMPKNNPDIIQFEDRYVKSICVMNWDTDNDGELSYAEAAAVTDLEMKFAENTAILCFDEFQHFTGLKWEKASDAQFYGCANLARITLPNTIKTLGKKDNSYGLFEGCKNLKKIVIPASVEIIYKRTFSACSSLEEIFFSEGSLLESFARVGNSGDGIFYNCVKLRTIDMQNCSLVNSIYGYHFVGVENLGTFKIGTIVPPTVVSETFYFDVCETATLYVPHEGLLDYARHSAWGKFILIKELE